MKNQRPTQWSVVWKPLTEWIRTAVAASIVLCNAALAIAQPTDVLPGENPSTWGCYVRYDYDAGGNRTDRYWYCWSDDETRSPRRVLGDNDMHLAPVPADDRLTVLLDSAVSMGKLELIDAAGKVVQESAWSGATGEIRTKTIPSGAYYVRLWVGPEIIVRSVLITH